MREQSTANLSEYFLSLSINPASVTDESFPGIIVTYQMILSSIVIIYISNFVILTCYFKTMDAYNGSKITILIKKRKTTK